MGFFCADNGSAAVVRFDLGRIKTGGFRALLKGSYPASAGVFLEVETADKGLFVKSRNTRRIRIDSAHGFGRAITERVLKMRKKWNRQSVLISRRRAFGGFTLAEVILVIVILAIAAMMAIPFAVSGAGTQLKSAAIIIASDLEYAKSMAISRGRNYSVVFNDGAERYQIEDANGAVISHPVKKGFAYVVDFTADSRLDRVEIVSANFGDTTSTVSFDYLGSPYNGSGDPLNSGVITLSAGGATMTVNVEPVTGYITISD
jgi:prepilin-type N-terminal cleavage/methylation domain-containing protein